MFSGNLDEEERLLSESERLHAATGTVAGRVLALQRLAEIALSRGQKWQADRVVKRALGAAATTWLNPHLVIRLKGLCVQTASTSEQVAEAILDGDRALHDLSALLHGIPRGVGDRPRGGWRARSSESTAGRSRAPRRHVERRAALWEARGVQRRAQGNAERALAAFGEAAARFAELHRPLDESRCRERMHASPSA